MNPLPLPNLCPEVRIVNANAREGKETPNLNFPKHTAYPKSHTGKDYPPGTVINLTVKDLLDPEYPDPILRAIEKMEKAGHDVAGLRAQRYAMRHFLEKYADLFEDLSRLTRVLSDKELGLGLIAGKEIRDERSGD